MINKQLHFETQLVDGSRYRKYYKYSLWPFSLYLLYGIVNFSLFRDRKYEDWDIWNYVFALSFCVFVLVCIFLYFYSRKKIVTGKLSLSENEIKIEKDKTISFNIADIENLEIQRGATYHYTHQLDNELVDFNNFIRFTSNEKKYEYEFCIDSKLKNETFENLIHTLQKNRVNLYYTSI